MKFCYVDESGTGDEPYAVMVGIIVDAARMHVTKNQWLGLLKFLSRLIKKPVSEIHTRDFYPGNDIWRGLDGPMRSRIITAIFNWLNKRKHLVIYSAIDKQEYNSQRASDSLPQGVGTIWTCLGLHMILGIQKAFQAQPKNKGNTLLVFDEEKREELEFATLINDPPAWTDEYYNKGKRQDRLDQIIDVPYFADSKHVGLVQMADFSAFFLRRYIEIKTGKVPAKYKEEEQKIDGWIRAMFKRSVSRSTMYPKIGRNQAAETFWSLAPDCIRHM